MKKIMTSLFVVLFVCGGVVFSQPIPTPTGICVTDVYAPGCPLQLQNKCSDVGGVYEWVGSDCQCTLFLGGQLQNTQSCESVPTAEDLELSVNNCEGGEMYGRNLDMCCSIGSIPYNNADNGNPKDCCDGTPYDLREIYEQGNDEDSETAGESIVVDSYNKKCCERGNVLINERCVSCSVLTGQVLLDNSVMCSDDATKCSGQMYDEGPLKKCCPGVVVDSEENPGTKACIVNTEGTAGMTINSGCLINGQCKYNIYETLGIRKSDQNPSVGSFVKDIVLAVTTFIGTVVAIVLIVSGVLYIMAGIKGDTSMADKAKKGIFNSVVGLVLVVTSYAIVRLIQFLATAGGG